MPATIATPPEIKEQCYTLYLQGLGPKQISHQTGVKYMTIAKWVSKGDWRAKRDGITRVVIHSGVNTVRDDQARLSGASEQLREEMAKILSEHTGKLAQVKSNRSLKHLAQVAAVLEPFARIAKTVHNWGNEPRAGLVLIDDLASMKRATCGPDTSTNGVLPSKDNASIPQSAESITAQPDASQLESTQRILCENPLPPSPGCPGNATASPATDGSPCPTPEPGQPGQEPPGT